MQAYQNKNSGSNGSASPLHSNTTDDGGGGTRVPHVLIVDDSNADRELFRIALAECHKSFKISEACSAEEALQMLQHIRPTVIVSDINMPKLNGLEMLCLMKASAIYKSIPVFIWSSSSRDVDIAFAKKEGAHQYFIKADNYKLLLSQVKEMAEMIEKL